MKVHIWIEVLAVIAMDGLGVRCRNMPVAHVLRMTAPLLVSTKPLSLLWRERDLVRSTNSSEIRRNTAKTARSGVSGADSPLLVA